MSGGDAAGPPKGGRGEGPAPGRRNPVAEMLGRMDVRARPSPTPAEQRLEARLAAPAVPPPAPAPTAAEPVQAARAPGEEPIKHLTLYLNKSAWTQLHTLALGQDQRPHSLLILALNRLFEAEGLAPLAHDRRKARRDKP